MRWFGVFSLTWWPCAVLALLAACVLIARWFAYSSSGRPRPKTYQELFGHFRIFFAKGEEQSVLSNRRLGLVWLGMGLLAMLSVGVGDIQDNVPCESACDEAGWASGRLRGNPHDPASVSGYECWCQRGSTWSPEPVSMEPR